MNKLYKVSIIFGKLKIVLLKEIEEFLRKSVKKFDFKKFFFLEFCISQTTGHVNQSIILRTCFYLEFKIFL